ncbi:MAG: hypothetical protein HC892_16725 [Saprospiraceae bacterium]|nr:hypothetical protein [Saprospiraceae bacterium]
MKPFQINIVNALVLIGMGLWAYLSAEDKSSTALIPVGFGLLFLLATPLFRKDNKVVAHIVVLLTFLLLFALAMPLKGRITAGDQIGIFRVATMMVVSLIALIIYIKSFIDARKARNNN